MLLVVDGETEVAFVAVSLLIVAQILITAIQATHVHMRFNSHCYWDHQRCKSGFWHVYGALHNQKHFSCSCATPKLQNLRLRALQISTSNLLQPLVVQSTKFQAQWLKVSEDSYLTSLSPVLYLRVIINFFFLQHSYSFLLLAAKFVQAWILAATNSPQRVLLKGLGTLAAFITSPT